MNKYLYKFTDISIKHRLDLFDKLIVPILCYGADVWGFIQAPAIERVHLRFLKTILRVKTSTPNDLVYAELGRQTLHTKRLVQKVLGNYNVFISLFKQRLTDNYVQTLMADYKHTAELVFSICLDLSNFMII